MGVCLMRTHGEHGVQKQYTLIGPFSQAAVIRNVAATVLVQFLINVDKGRRDLHIRLDGEAKAVCLPFLVVRVLP